MKTIKILLLLVLLPLLGFAQDEPLTGKVVEITEDTEELTLYDGDILTGTGGTDTRISIAAGAEITLSGVTITSIPNDDSHEWAGVTCLGNATIILADGTTNVVKSGGVYGMHPGIQAAETGTLTI